MIFDKKYILKLIRFIKLIFIFLLEKTKRIIKYIYRFICIANEKTININDLIKKGDITQNLIFNSEIYTLKNKLDINNKKFKYLPEGIYKVPNYHIYEIENGVIRAGTNNIFSQDGKKIIGIDFQEMNLDFDIIFNLENINISNIDGTLLVLGVGFIEENYSHAWTEFAARAYASKISKLKFDFILIDKEIGFLKEILKLINLKDGKIIYSSNYKYIKADKIIYPELINNFKEYFLNGVFVYHRQYLPRWIKYLYEDVSSRVSTNNLYNYFEKIYISRRNKKQRLILNEIDLISNLEELGFKTIYFEDFTVIDQIRIMKNAKKVIALHGAGLVNINFCKKGTHILELFPCNYQCAFFYMHANMCELNYDYYIGLNKDKLWKKSPIMENFEVDISEITSFIKNKWNN